jgi:calcineurin-like phosphoesterase family protein
MNKNNVWLVGDLYLDKSPWKDIKEGTDSAVREENFFTNYEDVVGSNDVAVFLGNLAIGEVAYWMNRIGKLPATKILLLGDQDKNRPKWYNKFGFKMVVPFNESLTFQDEAYGKVLFSHLPAFAAVGQQVDKKYYGLMNKHMRTFENSSCVLNIHGHTMGTGEESHRTFDASRRVPNILTLKQILDLKFKR